MCQSKRDKVAQRTWSSPGSCFLLFSWTCTSITVGTLQWRTNIKSGPFNYLKLRSQTSKQHILAMNCLQTNKKSYVAIILSTVTQEKNNSLSTLKKW